MSNKNLYTNFQEKFLNHSGRLFLESDHGTLMFNEIHGRTGLYVSLFEQMGIVKGDRVVVQVEKSIEAVLLYLSCLRFGAIYIPLNPAYTIEEVKYFLNDSMPALFVCSPEQEELMRPLTTEVNITNLVSLGKLSNGSLIEYLKTLRPSEYVEHCEDDDLAAILYTSGTTGRSKGAMLTHKNLMSNALNLLDYWAWQDDDVLLHALPIFHVHGLFVALHCALLKSSKVIFLDKFDANRVSNELCNSTVLMGVPTFYVRLLKEKTFNRKKCENMRLFISGSAPLLPETFTAFEELTGQRILERYGMTETGMLTSNPYNGNRIAGSVGYLLPDVLGKIVDATGKKVVEGKIGTLEVSGPNVFPGYWNMPEKTAEEFRSDGYFITGDMAFSDNTGRISIVGREKDLIISGGYNIYPKEIESILDDINGVVESCVIGLPHNDFGEAVVAVIIGDDSIQLSEKLIIDGIKVKLAKYKRPKAIIFAKELPRNTMGKVQKNLLRKKFNDYLQ